MTDSGLNEATVRKLAALARLALNDSEVGALVPELRSIVAHVDRMRAVDTSDVAPMTYGHADGAVLHVAAALDDNGDNGDDDTVPVLGSAAIAGSAGFDPADATIRVPKVID